MSALTWLLLTRAKNRLKTYFTKASNVIAAVFVAAMLGLVLYYPARRLNAAIAASKEKSGIM